MNAIYSSHGHKNIYSGHDFLRNVPDVLTVQDLQNTLKIGRTTAYKLIREGKIKCFRVGNSIKISKLSLLEYLNETLYTRSELIGSHSIKE